MTDFLAFTIVGLVTGSIYAIAASGLVVTYTTSGIFNFGHGAIGMVMAFLYWELQVNQGWPALVALGVVLFVAAPLLGVALERVLFRRLDPGNTGVSLVVTVGLLVLMLGIGQTLWTAQEARIVDPFFPGSSFEIFGVVVSYHRVVVLFVAAGVALVLRYVLFRTRVGVAMRAVVDNRELAGLAGALPEQVSQLSWAIGAMLATLAGILLAPELQLSHLGLTLLVVNGYAAAMFGRLRSLPMTFAGAIILGALQSYVIGYGGLVAFGKGVLGNNSFLTELNDSLPTIFLFLILLVLPQARLRAGRVEGKAMPRVPTMRQSLVGAAALVVVAALIVASGVLSPFWTTSLSLGLGVGLVMLSLVLLTGYGGQVSLMQYSFVGVGAFVMGKMAPDGSPLGLVVAGVAAAAVGALLALPALRLPELYLALATVAFALLADDLFFGNPVIFDTGSSITVPRLNLFGWNLDGDGAQLVLLAVAFSAAGIFVLWIRRGPFGRRLMAMSDSPAACATLGMTVVGTKTAVFAISAGMAGVSGALLGGLRTSASGNDFLMLQSLFLFLLVMVGGITSVSGAFIGGVVFALLPVVQRDFFDSVDLQGLFIGAGAIMISTQPNGFAGVIFARWDRFRSSVSRPGEGATAGATGASPPAEVRS